MAKRRKGNGSIRTFGGAWRHFRDWLHPRDAQGRFIDKPDYYVPPRQTNRQHRSSGVPKVQKWHEVEPWRNMPDPSQFTRPNDRIGWTRDSAPMGYAWRDPEDLTSPWRSYYIEPDMPEGTYAYIDSNGNILLSPEWFELSEEERRHVLYRAAGRVTLGGYLDKEREELFGPGATYANVFAGAGAYRGQHQPNAEGPPANDLLSNEDGTESFAPRDIYEHPEWYAGDPSSQWYRETVEVLRDLRGKPGDTPVKVYRAAPPEADAINPGDWVTLSPTYAREHGYHPDDESQDWPVLEATVPASSVRWAGEDLSEFGYFPDGEPMASLNGYVNEGDVLAEAYAILADGDGLWLEEEIPGLAAVVRREAIAQGLPIDEGEIAEPLEGDDRFSFGDEPFITDPPDFEDFDDYDRYREASEAWKNDVVTMVSRGELPIADADAYFALPGREDAWHALPPKLWHVGTATEAIVEGGFKTREQLGQTDGGLGLGGGPDDFISFTDDLSIAENIYSALLEGRAVAAGEIKFADLVQMDLDDRWGVGPGRITRQWSKGQLGIEWPIGEDMPELLKMKVEEIDAGPINDRGRKFNEWAWSRDSVGGPSNPVFFSTDWEGLAALDPADFSIIEIEPEPNRFGHTVGALGEWRLHPAAIPPTVAAVHRPAVDDEVLLPRRTLYRGIQAGFWTEEDVAALDDDPAAWLQRVGALSGGLGEHWSGDFDAANYYARGYGWGNLSQDWVDDRGNLRDEYALEDDQRYEVGIVFRAEVAESSIRQPGTAEWESTVGASSGQAGAFDRSHPENEFSVIPGEDLRIGGVMVTVTDIDTREKVSEQWLPLEAIQESVAANPDQRVRAINVFGALDGLLGGEKASDLLGSLTPVEVDALSFAAGFNLSDPRRWSPAEVRDARGALDALRDPQAAAHALSSLGFGDAQPFDLVDGDMTTPLAFLMMNRDGIEVSNGRVAIRLADGTELVNEELSARINFPGQTTPLPPGTWGLALAAQVAPNLVTEQSNYGIAIPDDKLRVMALLLNRHAPSARAARQAMVQGFNYDANAIFPPGSVLTNRGLVEGRFAAITSDTDIRARMVKTYTDLVDQFSTPFDSFGFVDILPIDGNDFDAPTEGRIAAYVTPAGTSYWNPAIFTPEGMELMRESEYVAVPTVAGLVSHEFAHRLFAGLVNDPHKLGVASNALTQANIAASHYLPPGVSTIEAARTLSPYAQTHPAEAYAELFAVWSAGENPPEWIRVWGDTLRRNMRSGGEHPISREIAELHNLDASRPILLEGKIFDPQAPVLPRELSERINAELDEHGDIQDPHVANDLAEAYDSILVATKPIGMPRQWAEASNSDDVISIYTTGPDGDELNLFDVSAEGAHVADESFDRAQLEQSARLWMERGGRGNFNLLVPNTMSNEGYVPPLVGEREIGALLDSLIVTVPAASRRTLYQRDELDGNDAITLEEFLELRPDVAEAMKSTENGWGYRVPLNIDSTFTDSRGEVMNKAATAIFEPRDKPLTELRAAKLERNYGEDFRARVQGEIDRLAHPPLIQLPAIADDEGVDLEEAWSEIEADVMYHFANWSHQATLTEYLDESGDAIYDFDPTTPDNKAAIESGAVTEIERDLTIAASIDDVTVDDEGVKLEFSFYSDEGDAVGTCTRTLKWDGSVYHDFLELEKPFRGSGTAYSWNRNNDAWYLANGFDHIDVHAALSEGGYQWASDFFTMPDEVREEFIEAIEDTARQVITHPGATKAEIQSSMQALLDIERAELDGRELDGWQVAHLGYHPAVTKDRQWIGRQVMQGSGWFGSKDLKGLMRAAAGSDVEMPIIPEGSGAVSIRAGWDPFWQEYEPLDMGSTYITSWIANADGYMFNDNTSSANTLRVRSTDDPEKFATYFIPDVGDSLNHPLIVVPQDWEGEGLDAIVAQVGAAYQRGNIDNFTVVLPDDVTEEDRDGLIVGWINAMDERTGPGNLLDVGFVTDGNVISTTHEDRRNRAYQSALVGSASSTRFGAEHLGNPAYGLLREPYIPTADAVDLDRDHVRVMEFVPEDTDPAGDIEGAVAFVTWQDANAVAHVEFRPGATREGELGLGLPRLDDEEQAVVLRAIAASSDLGYSFDVSPGVAALLQQPPQLGQVIPHDGESTVSVIGAVSRRSTDVASAGWIAPNVSPDTIVASSDSGLKLTVHKAADGTFHRRGALYNFDPEDHDDPLVDQDRATSQIASMLVHMDRGGNTPANNWSTVTLDLGDYPMATEVASGIAYHFDNNPGIVNGMTLPEDAWTASPEGVLTIDLTKIKRTKSWASKELVIAARQRSLQVAFEEWRRDSHPGESAAMPYLAVVNNPGILKVEELEDESLRRQFPNFVQAVASPETGGGWLDFARAWNAEQPEGAELFTRVVVKAPEDRDLRRRFYDYLWSMDLDTYDDEGDDPYITIKV